MGLVRIPNKENLELSKDAKKENLELDLKSLIELRNEHLNNSSAGCLNKNSRSDKATELREVCKKNNNRYYLR